MPRWARIALGFVAGLMLLVVAVVVFLTQTDAGRERLRRLALGRLTEQIHGNVRIGRLRGNLLTGATLVDVEITDSAGAPFLKADTVFVDYSIRSLFSRRIYIQELRLARPVIVLDKPPGQQWNFARIFPTDTVPQDTLKQGFGSWVRIEDLGIRDGRLLVRNEWQPDSTLSGAARDSAVADALSPDNRLWVVRAPGGYQTVQDFRQLNARLPLLRLADPDSANRLAEIAEMSTVAYLLRPPAAVIQRLSGRFVFSEDSLWFQNLRVALPGSRLATQGVYVLGGGGMRVGLRAAPFQTRDFQWVYPALPDSGGGSLEVVVSQRDSRTRVVARSFDVRLDSARLAGHADVQIGGDAPRFGDSELRFAGIDPRLVERLAPGVEVPVQGTAGGQVRLAGSPERLQVDGLVSVQGREGISRLVADGVVGTADGEFSARNLRLRLEPLRLDLARGVVPNLPIGGTLTGQATLTGSTGRGFALSADLVHFAPRTGRSRLLADGGVRMGNAMAADNLRIRLQPVQLALASAFAPDLPMRGELAGRIRLDGAAERLRVDADLTHREPGSAPSRLLAVGGVRLQDGFAANNLRLSLQPVQLSLARPFAPDLRVGGAVSGRLTLDGVMESLRVDTDLVHQGGGIGRSRVLATGTLQLGDAFAARGLRIELDPLQMQLVRAFSPDLPIDGILSGTAIVSGSPETRVAAELNLVHVAATGRSQVMGDVRASLGEPQRFDVRLRAPILSLATVGRFAPSAGLQGTASGEFAVRGTLADLALATDVAVRGGGAIEARGTFDLASDRPRYDLVTRLREFDAGALTTRAPATLLTGTLEVRGQGTDLATAQAVLSANLSDARVQREGQPELQGLDDVRVQARVDAGLLAVDQGRLRLASAQADLSGSFGLVAGRQGTLSYRIVVDSLSDFAMLLPPDTAAAAPDTATARQAADREPLAAEREPTVDLRAGAVRQDELVGVERREPGDSVAPLPLAANPVPALADSLSGSLRAQGTIVGSLERFDLRGTAGMQDVFVRGNAVDRGDLEYAWTGAGTPQFSLDVTAALHSIRAGSFAMDSVHTRVDYTGARTRGTGAIRVAVFQDPARDFRLATDFQVQPDRQEARFDDLVLRFDTTRWSLAQPARVGWGGEGVELDSIDLRSTTGGRVFADGRVAMDGPATLQLQIERLQIGEALGLVQDTVRAQGLLSLQVDVAGTARAPTMQGQAVMVDAAYDGTALPSLNATFAYANTELTAQALLTRTGEPLATADARLPVNLALAGVEGPRLLETGPLAVDVRADSVPLESLPSFTDAVEDVRGRVRGQIAVRGTVQEPDVNGVVDLDLGSLGIVQPGLHLRDIAGTLRIRRDSVFLDSLVARSGDGPIRLAGAIDISTPTEPGFDLALEARDARVLDNELGRLRADADLTVVGPFDGVQIGGTIQVDEGTLYIPESEPNLIDLEDPAIARMLRSAAVAADILPETNPLLANLRVDVGVRVARNTWARNADANVEIYTPEDQDVLQVQMDRRTQSLTMRGAINVDRGEYSFSGRRFQLTSGSVVFLGSAEVDPLLQLTAVHEVPQQNREPLLIQINIGGYLSEPRITLSSNSQPPLSQSDLLSFLAFGRSSSALLQPGGSALTGGGSGGGTDLGALATQQLAGVALGALVDDFVSDLEQQASRAGLDVIRISPADDLPEELVFQGTFSNILRGTEVEAGKYVSRRLFVAAQGRPTTETLPGLVLEYRTADGFLWRTTWEPRYLASQPTLDTDILVEPSRVFGSFLIWQRRF